MSRRSIVGALALLVMSLTASGAFAQPGAQGTKDWLRPENRSQTNSKTPASHGNLGRAFAAFALVGVGGYFVWRKTRNARQNPLPAKTHIRVIGGTLVGPKARAVVAEVGGRLILLGVTEQSVRKLAWLDAIDATDSTADREDRGRTNRSFDSQPERHLPLRRSEDEHNGSTPRSRFSALLKDAVGMNTRPMTDSALVVAEHTQDRVSLSVNRGQSRKEAPLIDIEGQAAGLVSRLSKAKQ